MQFEELIMLITRTSDLTGITRSLEIDITQEQLDAYYNSDMLLQDAFPGISADEREFIKTGITQKEWDMHLNF